MPTKRKKSDQPNAEKTSAAISSRAKSLKPTKVKPVQASHHVSDEKIVTSENKVTPVMPATTGIIRSETVHMEADKKHPGAAAPLAVPSSMRTKMLLANLTFVMMIAAVVSATVLISRNQNVAEAPTPTVAGVQQVSNTALGFQFDLPTGWTARLIPDGAILSTNNVEKGLIVLHVLSQDKAKALLEEKKSLPETMDVNAIDLMSPQLGQLNRFQIDGDRMYWWSLLSPLTPADQGAAAAFYRVTSTALIGKQVIEASSAVFYANEDGYRFSYPLTHRATRLTDETSKKAFSFLPSDTLKSLVTVMTVDGRMDGVFVRTSLDVSASKDALTKAGNTIDPEKSGDARVTSHVSLDGDKAFVVTVVSMGTGGTLWAIERQGSDLGLADHLQLQ